MSKVEGHLPGTPGPRPAEPDPAGAGDQGAGQCSVVVKGRDLHRTYGSGVAAYAALRGVDFELRTHEMVALLGPSGSGKSTLMHLLSGLDAPSAGTVDFAGRPLADMSEAELAQVRNRSMGFVLQRDNLIPSLTVEENVAAPLLIGGTSRGEALARARELLVRTGLDDRRAAWPAEVSGGEAQRATVIRACINEPCVVFADEPTGALDSSSGAVVIEMLSELAHVGGAGVLVVTHDPAVARHADRIAHLRDGRLEPPPAAEG